MSFSLYGTGILDTNFVHDYTFLKLNRTVGKALLQQGLLLSSVVGGLAGEDAKNAEILTQGGFAPIEFDVPRLRTTYTLQLAFVSLPPLRLQLEQRTEGEKNKSIITGRFGWVAILAIDGEQYFSEAIPAKEFTLKAEEKEALEIFRFETIPTTQQLQFTQPIVISGYSSSVQIEIFPYLNILSAENLAEEKVTEAATLIHRWKQSQKSYQYTGNMVVQQEFHKHGTS